jgi:hypothetical protein
VFWGGCVVFWCSFWVGFWLSESLRGVFTPARNGRRQGSPREAGGTLRRGAIVNSARAIGMRDRMKRVEFREINGNFCPSLSSW